MRDRISQKSSFFFYRLVTLTIGCFAVVSNDAIDAQIVLDNTVGSQIERVNATRERITGGTTRGSNLFHSFREFNISEGRAAYFANPAAIRTIFSRVTGNNPSQIFGTLGVEGNANLFFINPNGIIFGPNATLDVRGSFIASTANSIAFPNGQEFSATNPNAPPLLTIDVPVTIGLRFESDNEGRIFNAGDLQAGKHLALIGGRIVSTGQISAPGQDITLATVPAGIDSIVRLEGTGQYIGQSTQGTGQPNVAGRDILLRGGKIDASSTGTSGNIILNSAGDVVLSDKAVVDVRGGGGGSITVNARNLEISDASGLLAGIGEGLGSPNAQAGNIEINVLESIKVQGSNNADSSILNNVEERSIGHAGNVIINTGTLEGNGKFRIGSETEGRGNAGTVSVIAKDAISLAGSDSRRVINSDLFLSNSGIISNVQPSAIGNGGDMKIQTRSLNLSDGALISTSTIGKGNGGNLTINATDSVELVGVSTDKKASSGLEAQTVEAGKAGSLSLTTRQLLVRDGAAITTGTVGAGAGGNLTINASESVQLIGTSANGKLPSGIGAGTFSTGKSGALNLTTRQLLVRDGAGISTGTEGAGAAGNLTINASESVQVIGTSADGKFTSGLGSQTLSTGKAGDLILNTRQLLVQDGAFIGTATGGSGAGGNLNINAPESVQLLDTAPNGTAGGLFTGTTGTENGGKAGDLILNTRQLLVKDGAVITTITTGSGDGGNLTINASESVQLLGSGPNGSFSSLFTDTTGTENGGKAGNLLLNTRNLLLQDGARISARTLGDGKGGILTINASESIQLSGVRASDSSPTRITSEARGAGDAGILNISTGNLLVEDGAAITVDSQGTGIGGQIFLNADSLTLNKGTIFAETVSTDGGDITLNIRDLLLLRNGSQISTTAGTERAGGKGGDIFIDSGSIVAIPDENSDITANAFEGDGGRVFINTQSIFGIDFRSQLTPLSDITASSERGAAGEVIINTSGVEPTRGVEALTEERINVEVAQGCQVGTATVGHISFYNVGRGGLPPSPDDLLNSPVTQEWLSLEFKESNNSVPEIDKNDSTIAPEKDRFSLKISCS